MNDDILTSERLVELRRVEEPEASRMGVIRHVHPSLIVLQSVDDACRFDGFMALRPESLLSLDRPNHAHAYERVLEARGGRDTAPVVSGASTMAELLRVLCGETLVTVHDPDSSVCWIGRINRIDGDSIEMHLLRPNGEDGGSATLEVDEVRMVEWGTAYDEAIRLMER